MKEGTVAMMTKVIVTMIMPICWNQSALVAWLRWWQSFQLVEILFEIITNTLWLPVRPSLAVATSSRQRTTSRWNKIGDDTKTFQKQFIGDFCLQGFWIWRGGDIRWQVYINSSSKITFLPTSRGDGIIKLLEIGKQIWFTFIGFEVSYKIAFAVERAFLATVPEDLTTTTAR